MPEGHTLLRLARELTQAFGGRPVRVSSPQGRFAADAALVDGALCIGAESAGKHLFVELAGDRFVHVHLGLIGKFDVVVLEPGQPVPVPVGQVRLRMVSTGSTTGGTAYADLRGATQCDLIGGERRAQIVAQLGEDPLRPDA
ncbi:MAG: Fpg/Nei family DNA glycosylase, partial [Propionibacteriales bacterium]|nr:Fpg/Nei family DNA glycosylase [Propionibacteriales bacterium]